MLPQKHSFKRRTSGVTWEDKAELEECSPGGQMPELSDEKKDALLGVIRLDYDYKPALGDVACSDTFNYDVIYRTVSGLTFELCQAGELPVEVQLEMTNAVDWLVARGVDGISGDCGFMMHYQNFIREYTQKPTFMSALVQLPALMCTLCRDDHVAILTANGQSLSEPKLRELIRRECGVDTEDKHFLIFGCEDVPGFDAVAKGEKVDVENVRPGIVAKAREVVAANQRVRYFLLECTELPPYADAIREATGLPVFDAVTCCNFFIMGSLDHNRFGKRRKRIETVGF